MAETRKNYNYFYDAHYASQSSIEAQWTELMSFDRLDHVKSLIDTSGSNFNNLLDVGAGDGNVLRRLYENKVASQYYGVEISESSVKKFNSLYKQDGLSLTLFDGYSIPFSDSFFDLVACFHVIEHVEYPRLLLREMARVGKEFFIFEVPLDHRPGCENNLNTFLAYGHITPFTPTSFKYLIQSEGFEIVKELYSNIPFHARKFMINHSQKKKNKKLRILKSRLGQIKKKIIGILYSLLGQGAIYREFEYSTFTCLAKYKGRPEVNYSQVDLW